MLATFLATYFKLITHKLKLKYIIILIIIINKLFTNIYFDYWNWQVLVIFDNNKIIIKNNNFISSSEHIVVKGYTECQYIDRMSIHYLFVFSL